MELTNQILNFFHTFNNLDIQFAIVPWIIAGGIAANLAGSLIGHFASAGDKRKAEQAMEEAFKEIENIQAPPDESKEIILEKFRQIGLYTPKLEAEVEKQVSRVATIPEDTKLQEARREALEALRERAVTGITPEERAQLGQLRREAAGAAQARRQQILQQFAMRGAATPGLELATQLQAAQAGAEQEAQAGERLGAMASQRALEAILGRSQLAGQIAGEEFGRERTRRGAQEEIERFNIQQQIERQRRNVERENQAAAANLTEAQRVLDANVNMGNAEKIRQSQERVNFWKNQLTQTQAKVAGLQAKGAEYSKRTGETAQFYGKLGTSVGAGAGQVAGYLGDQQLLQSLGSKTVAPQTRAQIPPTREILPAPRGMGGIKLPGAEEPIPEEVSGYEPYSGIPLAPRFLPRR